MQIALEVAEVDRIETYQRREQPNIGLREIGTYQEASVGESPLQLMQAVEQTPNGGFIGVLASREAGAQSFRRGVAAAGLCSAAGGALISLLGGRLMGGSLALLADGFPGSRLQLDHIGSLFGESGFGPASQAVTAAMEGLLFGACVAAAMMVARPARLRRNG